MKRSTGLALLVVAMVAGGAGVPGLPGVPGAGVPAFADAPATAPSAKVPKGIAAELDEIDKAVTLTDAQKPQVQAKLVARNEAVAEWSKTNGANWARLQAQRKEAVASGDKAAIKTASDAIAPLQAERDRITRDTAAEIEALFTPDQVVLWHGYEMTQPIVHQLAKLNLTDDQVKQIRSMGNDAAKSLDATATPKAKAAAQNKLRNDIRTTVLTDAQREALAATGRPGKGAAPTTAPATK